MNSVLSWAEGRPEFVNFLTKYDPEVKLDVKDDILEGLPPLKIDGFIEDVLYLMVDYDSVTRRINIVNKYI